MSKIYSNKILKVAKSWLNTKFHYGGRVKINNQNNGGIDCIGLILKIGEEINSTYNGKNIIMLDQTNYSKFSNDFEMKKFLDKYFIKIKEKDVKIGDIVYVNFNNSLEHVAIISDVGLIHCYVEARKVVEHSLSQYWKDKIKCFYRYPNL